MTQGLFSLRTEPNIDLSLDQYLVLFLEKIDLVS